MYLIDKEDEELCSHYSWSLNNKGYYFARVRKFSPLGEKGKSISMHRLIMHEELKKYPMNYEVDHINRIKTDNRKENLRCVSSIVNKNNLSLDKRNKLGIPGVRYRARLKTNPWETKIKKVFEYHATLFDAAAHRKSWENNDPIFQQANKGQINEREQFS